MNQQEAERIIRSVGVDHFDLARLRLKPWQIEDAVKSLAAELVDRKAGEQ